MKSHPYESNSKLYNFLFHPLYSKQKPTRALSIVSQVFLSVVTAGAWLIAFGVVHCLDRKKVTLWKKENSEKDPIQQKFTPKAEPTGGVLLKTKTAPNTSLVQEPKISKVVTEPLPPNPILVTELPPVIPPATDAAPKEENPPPARPVFDPQPLKAQIKSLEAQEKVFKPSECDLEKVVLQEKHKNILKIKWYQDFQKEVEKGNLEIISWGHWGVLAFPDIPGVVFKFDTSLLHEGLPKDPIKSWIDIHGRKLFGSEAAEKICSDHNLFYLQVPKAKMLDLGEGRGLIVEERGDNRFPEWQQQEEIYQFIQKDEELKDYSEELLRQLILFAVVSGFGNTKYDKIPILPNGKVFLDDVQIGAPYMALDRKFHTKSKTFGLYNTGCYEEKGIFDHIIPERRESLKQYALEVTEKHCPEELENLKEILPKFKNTL